MLEQRWALVGWELQTAKKSTDIRNAFLLITGFNSSRLELFLSETTTPTTSKELSALRKSLEVNSDQIRAALKARDACKAFAERARHAVKESEGKPGIEDIAELCALRERRLREAEAYVAGLEHRREEMKTDLEAREAYFAQSELLRFLESGRYSITPEKVANAMAGLPLISWRQSANRCQKNRRSKSPTYETFLHIQRVFKSRPRKVDNAIEKMKAYLQDRKRNNQFEVAEMRNNWYFLQSAIEDVWAAKHHPAALAFRITAEYQRRIEHKSNRDSLIEEEHRLG